jgi:hypothetical protein
MLKKAIPVLPATNITETINFFESKLGFVGTNYGNYAILKYKNTEIHLLMSQVKQGNVNPGCLILVDNIEDLYTRFCAKGLVGLKGKLQEKQWGTKEFIIVDNNNNHIRFGEKR